MSGRLRTLRKRPGRTLPALIYGVLWLSAMPRAARCDDLPRLPIPAGFVESSSLVPGLKEQALLGHSAQTRLIGVYLLPDELAKIMRGTPGPITILCRAYLIDEFGSDDDAKASFDRMVASAKQEASTKFDLSDPGTRRIIQRYLDVTREAEGTSVQISGAMILGSILETQDAFATSIIAAASVQTDYRQTPVPLATAVAWLRNRKQILELSDVAQFRGNESIATVNDIMLDWIKASNAAEQR